LITLTIHFHHSKTESDLNNIRPISGQGRDQVKADQALIAGITKEGLVEGIENIEEDHHLQAQEVVQEVDHQILSQVEEVGRGQDLVLKAIDHQDLRMIKKRGMDLTNLIQ